MPVKKSIFGSKGEEGGFRSIAHSWGDQYYVASNFQFAQLFEPDENIRDKSNFFFKTSIDYILCSKDYAPILAIDFDGLGQGFSRDRQYVQTKRTEDPHRKIKFDFKIQYAEKNRFPYYIVSSDEFEHLGKDISLTVVDGIIGSVLAKKDFDEQIPLVIQEHRADIENLPAYDRQDYFQDLVTSQEVESDFAYNPITQKTAEIMNAILGLETWRVKEDYRTYFEPELPDPEGTLPLDSPESLQARFAALEDVKAIKCICTLFDTPIGEVSEVAIMRNVGDLSQNLSLIKEIAELLVWAKYARILSKKPTHGV